MNKYAIFHKRVRVFYQGFQTRENNRIHETVYQAIFIVLENLLNTKNNENTRPERPSGFYCPECFATSREQ